MGIFDKIKSFFNSLFNENFYTLNYLRPPGSVNEELFVKLCIRCSKCIEVCPYGVIKRSNNLDGMVLGTPYINATKKGCRLCMQCVSVCPTGAIDKKLAYFKDVKLGTAEINTETCLNNIYYKQLMDGTGDGTATICSQCFNNCPLRFEAIVLKDTILPTITDKCTGCGICVESCPTKPKSANVIPNGMERVNDAGFYNIYIKGK